MNIIEPVPVSLEPAYDVIIAGGGSAGCVLARRLTEDAGRRVLLVEAGPSGFGIGAIEDAARWPALLGGPFDWGDVYAGAPALGGRRVAVPHGRILGGSSSINAMLWYRGHPADYDRWAAEGATGWDFASVLPYFRRSEDWEGGENQWRGAGGPMRIERSHDPHPLAQALLDAAASLGVPVIEDPNAADNEGACLANLNMRSGRRWSAADGYLYPVLERPNLTVLTSSTVLRLHLEQNRCAGIVHVVNGQPRITRALDEVVLSAGAFASPVLLLRSGLGASLPGIGRNLQDHPLLMGVNFRARKPIEPLRDNGGGSMMNWSSCSGLPGPDLHAFVVQGPHAEPPFAQRYRLGADCFAISPGLMRSQSRGELRLRDDEVVIQPNYLQEPSDLLALMRGVEMCMDLAATPAFAELTSGPAAPRRRLDQAGLEAFVRESCSTFFHPCGTCRMGRDEQAVVDPDLRVHGIDGLRVADASVMPSIPSCNTLAPVIMIAERAADLIRNRA